MTLTLTLTFQMLLFEQHQIWENYSECQVWDCWRVTLTTFNLGGVLTNLFLQTFAEVTVMSLLFVADFSLYSKLVVDIFISNHSKCISPIFVVSRVLVGGGVVVYPVVVGPVPAQET